MSEGSIKNLLERVHDKVDPFKKTILQMIKRESWVGSDETGDRVNGKSWWRWVWQNTKGSFFHCDKKRNYDVVKTQF
jgi:Transposase IS66 family